MSAEKVSIHLANILGKNLEKSDEEIAVLNYGLFVIIQAVYSIILILVVGLVTGLLKELVIISTFSAMMKRYAGGPHASTPNRCLSIGILIATAFAFLCRYFIEKLSIQHVMIFILVVIITGYYVLYLRCPVGSKEKPLKKESIRTRLRKKAFKLMNVYSFIVLSLFLIYSIYNNYLIKSILISILFGIILQIFTISKIGENIVMGLDKYLDKLYKVLH